MESFVESALKALKKLESSEMTEMDRKTLKIAFENYLGRGKGWRTVYYGNFLRRVRKFGSWAMFAAIAIGNRKNKIAGLPADARAQLVELFKNNATRFQSEMAEAAVLKVHPGIDDVMPSLALYEFHQCKRQNIDRLPDSIRAAIKESQLWQRESKQAADDCLTTSSVSMRIPETAHEDVLITFRIGYKAGWEKFEELAFGDP